MVKSFIMIDDTLPNSQVLRSKRLNQIACLILGALTLLLPVLWFEGLVHLVYPLVGGVVMMLVCLILNHIKYTDLANTTLTSKRLHSTGSFGT